MRERQCHALHNELYLPVMSMLKSSLRAIFLTLALFASCSGLGSEPYDPFADYSDFDEDTSQEQGSSAPVGGRRLSVGIVNGVRNYTDSLEKSFKSSSVLGASMTLFFSLGGLHLALEGTYLIGESIWILRSSTDEEGGVASIQDAGVNLRYYFITDNVSVGISDFAPYVVLGYSQISREIRGLSRPTGRDSSSAGNGGFGLEIPLIGGRAFLGFQGVYQFVNFPNEDQPVAVGQGEGLARLDGNTYLLTLSFGANF